MTRPGISRRKFLACSGLGGLGVASYAGLVEPYRLEIGRHEFKTRAPAPARPLKLLHLSDLHASWAVSLDFIEQAVAIGLELKPDLVCITGDFITRQYRSWESYARVLARLQAAAPVFACLGNHDGGQWSRMHGGYETTQPVRQLLEQSRIQLLHNCWTGVRLNGRELKLIGLADLWSGHLDIGAAFPPADAPGPELRIVLSHNPDSKELLRRCQWDLLLCGHTHGGQVVLPLLGAPFAPVRDKRFLAGMLPWEDRWIHITRGVGNVHGLRINCPPEVSLITLV